MSPRDPLTYRHPRTLVEAFGPDARTACAIEAPAGGEMNVSVAAVLSAALAALAAVGLLSGVLA